MDALLIGCGHRGRQHARALADAEGLRLAAVCDRNPDRAAAAAEEVDTGPAPATYGDVAAALAEVAPDHVTLATGPTGRPALVERVLDAEGAPPASLLLEKPIADDLAGVERIAGAVRGAGTDAAVCHQKPEADEFRTVREWLDAGALGDLRTVAFTAKGGLAAQGTHVLHAVDWFVGARPERVRAAVEGGAGLDPAHNPRIAGHAEPEDALLEVTYPDARAFVHLGPAAPDVPEQADTYWYEFRGELLGDRGSAELVLGEHAALRAGDRDERVDARPFEEGAYMTRRLYESLVEARAAGRAHYADLDPAAAAHRTADAALRSALASRAVDPESEPPALGRSSNDRLRTYLGARAPVAVSTLPYRDRPREAVFGRLADLGVERVDLWGFSEFATHFDPDEDAAALRETLEANGLSAPVLTAFDERMGATVEFAAELGAETVVTFGRTPDREGWDPETVEPWLDRAAELDVTVAMENHAGLMESVAEAEAMLEALDHPAARVALAPPHLAHCTGESTVEAIRRLGGAIEVLYLWDTAPGIPPGGDDRWWENPDDQVPGGGGAIDLAGAMRAAVEHCPTAEWTLCYHGTGDWDADRVDRSVARSLRAIEARRPLGPSR